MSLCKNVIILIILFASGELVSWSETPKFFAKTKEEVFDEKMRSMMMKMILNIFQMMNNQNSKDLQKQTQILLSVGAALTEIFKHLLQQVSEEYNFSANALESSKNISDALDKFIDEVEIISKSKNFISEMNNMDLAYKQLLKSFLAPAIDLTLDILKSTVSVSHRSLGFRRIFQKFEDFLVFFKEEIPQLLEENPPTNEAKHKRLKVFHGEEL